jgi:opacity protein-like surface antigen
MKNRKITTSLVVAFALVITAANSEASTYVLRTNAGLAVPKEGNLDYGIYYSAEFMRVLDKNNTHEIGLEIGHMGFDYDDSIANVEERGGEFFSSDVGVRVGLVPLGFRFDGNQEHKLLLLSYRYNLKTGSGNSPVFFINPSMGCSFTQYQINFLNPSNSNRSVIVSESVDKIPLSMSLTLGFDFEINERWHYSLSYRYATIASGDGELLEDSLNVNFQDVNISIYRVGVSYSF